MIQTLTAKFSRLNKDLEVARHLTLAGKVGESKRAKSVVLLAFAQLLMNVKIVIFHFQSANIQKIIEICKYFGNNLLFWKFFCIFVPKMQISDQEILRRRDMREVLTFTIDPADAKDFDDALSFEDLGDGTCQVGVHIADVSYYVQPGSTIDDDAYRLGTSTYLVDHVEPMLPEELCNDICSLRPDEDKLTMSVVMTVDGLGAIVRHKICRCVIRSNARLTYEQAQAILDGDDSRPELANAIRRLNEIACLYRADRMKMGALDIEQDEPHFVLDAEGRPTEIVYHEAMPANHLIEEWMLMANKTVAKDMYGHPMVWRVHDIPDREKMDQVHAFRRMMGSRVGRQYIDMLTVRAMAKAEYSTVNIGHYGLRFPYYTHFTSPIRRYPDLMVHRLVAKYILGERDKGRSAQLADKGYLTEACLHCSKTEVDAAQAERDSIKYYQALWLQDHVGQDFDGHIVGVTEFGLFVRLDESRCEGLVHISTIESGDYMHYDEKFYRLIAQTSGRTYTIGDALRVRVTRVDTMKRQIDMKILSDETL